MKAHADETKQRSRTNTYTITWTTTEKPEITRKSTVHAEDERMARNIVSRIAYSKVNFITVENMNIEAPSIDDCE